MFSIQAKFLIIAIFLGILVIFLLQNTQPVPFVLFSYPIPRELSIGILILLAVFAGILTSLILQLLNQGNKKTTSQFSTSQKTKIPETNYNYSARSRSQKQVKSEFKQSSYIPQEQEYIKEERTQQEPLSSNQKIEDILDKTISQEEKLPVTDSSGKKEPEDSIYSYNYRKNKDKNYNKNQTDDVYDANYRVIIPPYQTDKEESSTNREDNNDEDWI